jgi:hypothetical protein
VERLRERRIEVDLMGDNLLAVVKQQKVEFNPPRSVKFVEPSRPLTIPRKGYRCICKGRYIKVFYV